MFKTPRRLQSFPQKYIHRSKQIFDSGLQLEMLQEYVMISLDIFHMSMQNKPIETKLEAWLTFLGCDDPEKIVELITTYPEFKAMYETLYQICQNVEGVMGFFSEELRIMDQNLAQYMIEEQQKEIEANQKIIEENQKIIEENQKVIEKQRREITERDAQLEEKDVQIEEKDVQIEEKDVQIERLKKELEKYKQL